MDGDENLGPGFPIKQFVRIDSADITDAINILIVQINDLLLSLGAGSAPEVTQKQFRTWLATNGSPAYIYTIDNAVPADISNDINIAWDQGNTMLYGDALYNFIESTLGFTASQMLVAFAAMSSLQS